VTAYLPYSQLLSIAEGRLLHSQPEDVPGHSINETTTEDYHRTTLHISASSRHKEFFCTETSNKVHGARFYVLTAVLINNLCLLGCYTV
jgi:hypothetical protein